MDHEVLERFRQGDETAVKAVYERYAGPVFAVALGILGDRELAADATQQTFIKAWKAASTYDPQREFSPWIYAIARRTAIDIYRAETRSRTHGETDVAVVSPGLETAWEVFEVRLALERLPDNEREVLRLNHLEGLSHAEIAERLDIPLGTVKSRSHRAHRRLLELLRHLEET
ncbi:MAG: sigma-70 family RNA polymerase sigma factor [Actinobacteria bacterium]|nr:sigma-70 family RNA polymerase sigma factor [Actinomycetota bacterium]MCI0543994.1 sigma-70 family RNA polymerase sigma factor [Actinomycetota bacterium]MCI0679673.1 sigma-70 family RNA polymerase sigma factor [Actinomycetota bacterium]